MMETKDLKTLFIPYKLAVLAKEAGFREACLGFYAGNPFKPEVDWHLNIGSNLWHTHKNSTTAMVAPLYQQITDWFRNTHKIKIDVCHADSNGAERFVLWKWNFDNNVGKWERISFTNTFTEYYHAYNTAIEEAFKLLIVKEGR